MWWRLKGVHAELILATPVHRKHGEQCTLKISEPYPKITKGLEVVVVVIKRVLFLNLHYGYLLKTKGKYVIDFARHVDKKRENLGIAISFLLHHGNKKMVLCNWRYGLC
jgi:hypothetical protein